jgi:hypothetical protein
MATKLPVYWAPHSGQQTLAATCPVDEILHGGTRGGGKTAVAVGRQVRGATKHGATWRGLMARKKYKDLGKLKLEFDNLIRKGMPAERLGGTNQTNIVRFLGGPAKGAEITLTAFQHVKQLDDWQGFEFNEVTIDEAPQISYIATVLDKMRGTLRSVQGIHPSMFLTGNPGGPGAGTLKMLFKLADFSSWGKVHRETVRFDLFNEEVEETITRIYLHSILEDNPSIDPRQYKKQLAGIADQALLAAWLRGDWNVTIGQAFHVDPSRHVIKPIWPIPEHVPVYMTLDWGYGAPFSIGWWWVDNDNRVYRFAEWYGWDGKNPNRGIRLTDREIAHGILAKERDLGIGGRRIDRLAGPDSFRKKPNYLGGGQGPSTADEFKDYANSGAAKDLFGNEISLDMRPGDADRAKKLRQFRNRLAIPPAHSELPMLVVYETCTEWIRTIPSIALDEDNIEVIEEGQEDHCYDDSCHICMARPISGDLDAFQRVQQVEAAKKDIKKLDRASMAAAQELFLIRKQIADNMGLEPQNDPMLSPEVFGMEEADFDSGLDLEAESLFNRMPQLRELVR